MFQKTQLKLTALNAVVFLIILVFFGASLFGFMKYKLFDPIDNAMRKRVESVKLVNNRFGPQGKMAALLDPRTILLLRDQQGTIINVSPHPLFEEEDIASLIPSLKLGELQTIRAEEHFYRTLNVPFTSERNRLTLPGGEERIITEVIAISIVDSEVRMLHRLSMIILTGLLAGMTVVCLASYFLARRALVPIRLAWEKQQQFVADASHELRTPLSVIKTNAELMLRHPDHTVEEESVRISSVLRESMRMGKLVSTLLTLARADANQIELQFGPVEVKEVLQQAAEQFVPLAEMKGIQLHIDFCDGAELWADRERIHQLLVIILDNAIKYTPDGGKISVSCRRQGNNAAISIEDNGAGISPDDLPYIFDRFYRGDKARSREAGGAGLGLAIAKWIVDKHGGKIHAESKLGVGSKFTISMPIRK
jgi:signal transduction histidine kinase